MKKPLLGASAILALALVALPAAAACDPATHAVQYLHGLQLPDGSVGSVGQTADYVLGAAADGIDPKTLTAASGKSAFDFFATDLAGAQKSLVDANSLGKLIQALVAGHFDPHRFGGLNLLDELRNGSTPGGSPHAYYDGATGSFFDSRTPNNQTFTQANAILGLAAASDASFKVPPAAIIELKSLQATSGPDKGGWPTYGTDDSNGTSMALMALVAAGSTSAKEPAIFAGAFAFLMSLQDGSSGGFTYCCAGASDPQSDSLTIQALVAAGENPAGPKWTNAKGNATTDLLSFQDPASGGFAFAHSGKPEVFATSQAIPGLLLAPFPITGVYSTGATAPGAGCPAPPGSEVRAATTAAPALPDTGRRGALVGLTATPQLKALIIWAGLGLATAGAALGRERRRSRR